MIKYCLMGAHQHRTPLSYGVFQRYLPDDLVPVDRAHNPDMLVFGYVEDFQESFPLIHEVRAKNPGVKLVVLSEEPFWDTLWTDHYTERKASREIDGESILYFAINHFNSDIFRYQYLPYLITTEDRFFVRYAMMFARNINCTEQDFQRVWGKAAMRQTFYAEKRFSDKFAFHHPGNDVRGLCQFRSRLAQSMLKLDPGGTKAMGRGWGKGPSRQRLPDWHLDKLAALDGHSRIISALENTHQPLYITEKLFDAFACLGVPLYCASAGHSLHDWLPEGAYINLHGAAPDEAADAIRGFVPDQNFLTQYRDAQQILARRFASADTLELERRRTAQAVYRALSEVVDHE